MTATKKIQFNASPKANELLKQIKKVSVLKGLDMERKPELVNLSLELLANALESKMITVEKLANTIKQ